MSADELTLVDANVLVYASYDQHQHHPACKGLLAQSETGEARLCLTSQVMAEFFATVTNHRRVSEPFTTNQAVRALRAFSASLIQLPVPVDVADRWMSLVDRESITGADIFDVQLVATMLANDVHRIYTFNTKDFASFPEIIALPPSPLK